MAGSNIAAAPPELTPLKVEQLLGLMDVLGTAPTFIGIDIASGPDIALKVTMIGRRIVAIDEGTGR